MKQAKQSVLLLLLGLTLAACGEEAATQDPAAFADPNDSEAPLSDLGSLLTGAPDNTKLPDEAKADAVFPAKFDVVGTQSPVKSQGSRGVCSIFSTLGLMEHLYIKEGTIKNPDFSEQFLQWSTKFEVGSFKNTSGSNADVNLDAITRFGVVDEETMPYEPSPWGTSKDERCTGEEAKQPTECWTNGHPSDAIKQSKRWNLPRGRFVSSQVRNLKAAMFNKQTAVVSGMSFFYQSWNHRRSELPVNSQYWSEGYVLSPNAKDRELSQKNPAGHSILLVGWDDNLEVTLVDDKGQEIKNADGTPKKQKGFFLFKNSWGTSGFGLRNPFGPGYGWISYEYIEEFASSMTSEPPRLNLGPEVCDDGKDNNFDRQSDCADPKCGQHPACAPTPVGNEALRNAQVFEIPDNNPQGITSTIEVGQDGNAGSLTVDVDVTHPFIGDLVVTLISPSGKEVVLHNKTGASQDDLKRTFTVDTLAGEALRGTWKLKVADTGRSDTGRLNAWGLSFGDNGGTPAPAPTVLTGSATPGSAIPDNNADGASSSINIPTDGTVRKVKVSVDIAHTFIGDLVVTLSGPDGTTVTLHDKEGEGADNLARTFEPLGLAGKAAKGDWTLHIVDTAADDSGTLRSWSLELTAE